MVSTYNLIDVPWIPCIDAEGRAVSLGLRDVLLRAHALRELGGESPLVTAAIYRLLLAVLHRIHGPALIDDWANLWEAERLDAGPLDAYLARWHDRFDLFHPERPFYQAPDMEPAFKPKSITALVFDAASGNNATLFDHHTDAEGARLTPDHAARALLAAQAFGLAGLCMPGYTFTDAPWTRGVVFLAQGDTVFQTLLLNLIRYDDESPLPRDPQDRPAWEMDDPFTPARQIPLGYLDYLTWHNRRVHLLPEVIEDAPLVRSMRLGPGLRLDADVTDPQKHYRRDDRRGLLARRFSEDRALWRDSAALFSLNTDAVQPPRALAWMAELMADGSLESRRPRRVLALGMANNQAKVEFFRTERWPLPLAYLQEPPLVEALADALQLAEGVASRLWGAARTMASLFVCPESDLDEGRKPDPKDLDAVMGQWDIRRRYWAELEAPFRLTLETLPQDREAAFLTWQTTLRDAAWRAFEGIASNLDAQPRTLKAAVRGRDRLAAGLAKELTLLYPAKKEVV